MSDYALVLHDRDAIIDPATGQLVPNARQNASDWTFKKDKTYPAPVPISATPAEGATTTRRMSKDWFEYVGSINTSAAWAKARVNWSGYFNAADNPEWPGGTTIPLTPNPYPKPAGVTSILNYVKVLEIKNGAARIETFLYSQPPPDPPKINPQTHPWLYCFFTSIAPDGTVGKAPNGLDFVFPLLAPGDAWIRLDRLSLDVELPTEATMPTETRPLIRDTSRHNGFIDAAVSQANGVRMLIPRAGISWGYSDAQFVATYQGAKDNGLYRSSYHVIYTDQPIVETTARPGVSQLNHWFNIHPKRDVIPRVIDFEVDRGDTPAQKAAAMTLMSDEVQKRDGERPIIYSRTNLINQWLVGWSDDYKNDHYYIIAQYLTDPTKEHPGPPDIPNGIDPSRIIMHQSADKLPGFPGEAQSAALDRIRWQNGDNAAMDQFIAANWGTVVTPPPPPGDDRNDILEEAKTITANALEAAKT